MWRVYGGCVREVQPKRTSFWDPLQLQPLLLSEMHSQVEECQAVREQNYQVSRLISIAWRAVTSSCIFQHSLRNKQCVRMFDKVMNLCPNSDRTITNLPCNKKLYNTFLIHCIKINSFLYCKFSTCLNRNVIMEYFPLFTRY